MKKLYFLVVLVISFATQAQIVNIPDANFKAKLLSASPYNGVAYNFSSSTNSCYIDTNWDGEIQITEALAIRQLNLNSSSISSLTGIENFTNLELLVCEQNQLSYLDVSQLVSLSYLSCALNQLTVLNIQGCTNLGHLNIYNNNLTSLNLQGLINLQTFWGSFNLLNSLDVSECINLQTLECNNNQLATLFIKNGKNETINFSNNPNLFYVCSDDSQLLAINNAAITNGQNCHVNSYCSFVPGGTFYTIQGKTKLDLNNNGCDNYDNNFSKMAFIINNGANTLKTFSNLNGYYSISVQSGIHSITTAIENPTYFNISPTSFVANFPAQTSPLVQDFCVTANGVHHDVEVTIIPTNQARPGFDANYTVIFKNKGNQVENGAVTLDFNDAVLDLVSANPTFSSQATNSLVWNYTNLQPLETRTIDLVFNVNSPTETPAVNIDDQLNYTATITPLTTDEFQYDNTSGLKQLVVGSYDPNDKTCIEGTIVGPDMIGQYVHYVIRFENTGTYPAENIVVKDMIDLTKFDVNTLIPLHSSHDFFTRINADKVEFIFEGINLPFDDANNDGYVAFKIKTKSNLVVGNTFSNNANIYFDYNFPITTNTFTTTIQVLKVNDFEFGTHFTLYPNPVKDVLNLQSKDNTAINSIEIYNILGQVVLAVPNAISTVDVSKLQSGNYFVKVNTDLGVSNTKFIKE